MNFSFCVVPGRVYSFIVAPVEGADRYYSYAIESARIISHDFVSNEAALFAAIRRIMALHEADRAQKCQG